METKKRLRILFLEDDPEAAHMAVLMLREADLSFDFRLATKEGEFVAALNDFGPDLVISDYSLPAYDGMLALRETRKHLPSVPFILLTGSINEETAVGCIKAGATDYVLKEHLKKLPFAVKDALAQAGIRAEKEKAEAALRENEERLRHYFATSPTITYVLEIRGRKTRTVWVSGNITRLLGYSLEEVFAPDWWEKHLDPEDGPTAVVAMEELFSKGSYIHEYRFHRKDGSTIWIHDDVRLLSNDDGTAKEIIGSWTDVTERKAAEDRIRATLEEKQVLLQELYHRTKNNMQVIIAMLSLQAAYSKDETYRKNARTMENRILSMSLVQEKLYHLKHLSRIDLREYIDDLVNLFSSSYKLRPGDVTFTLGGKPVPISIDAAVPCGLVLNELVSNSLQHAFVDGRKGRISIDAERTPEDLIVLSYADNGIGLPAGFGTGSHESLGYQLVVNTVEYQLKGRIDFASEGGMSCRIEFPDKLGPRPF